VVRGVHGLEQLRDLESVVVEAQLPRPGQQSSASYEGDGFVILRHPETAVVGEALRRIVTGVRVELG